MDEYGRSATTTTVKQLFDKAFPQLEKFIQVSCPDSIIPLTVRPLLGHLATKIYNLWSREQSYVWVQRHFRLTASMEHERCRQVSLDSLIHQAIHEKSAYAIELLRDILEGEKRVDISIDDDAATGCFSSDPKQRCHLYRMDEHCIDSIGRTNADKSARNDYEAPMGLLGSCNKEYPSNKTFTPGLFIVTCTCKYKTVLLLCFMAYGYFFLLLRNRFPIAPRIVYYDKCMSSGTLLHA